MILNKGYQRGKPGCISKTEREKKNRKVKAEIKKKSRPRKRPKPLEVGVRFYKRASWFFPSFTRPFQSERHFSISARRRLSSSARSIQRNKTSSSSGIKKEDSSDRIVSKLACEDVIWSE